MKDKFKILAIDKNGLTFPKGWVSAVLPPGVEPSQYERSPQSPWKIIETSKDPRIKRKRKGKALNCGEHMCLVGGDLKMVSSKDSKVPVSRRYALNRYPHPPGLRKSSLIWDYGPGRTYSHPQSAFDALAAYWGVVRFTETQYVRGWTGEYLGNPDTVLEILDVFPSPDSGNHLVFDVEPGQEVRWAGGYLPVMGAGPGDISVPVLFIRGLEIAVTTETDGIGVAGFLVDGFGDIYHVVDRWILEDCTIKHEAQAGNSGSLGVLLPSLRSQINRCKIIGFENGFPTREDFSSEWQGVLTIFSSIVDVSNACIFLNPPSGAGAEAVPAIMTAYSIYKGNYGLYHLGTGFSVNIRHNSIFDVSQYVLYLPEVPFILDVVSNGNCYNYGTAFAYNKNGNFPLDTYKTRFLVDEDSLEADPLIQGDYTLDPLSPCFRAGQGIGKYDIQGNLISRTILDIGPWQDTVAAPFDPFVCGYTTPAYVIDETGVEPDELDVETQTELEVLLCRWIGECTEVVENYCETSWDLGSVPEGITRACTMMVSQVVGMARQKRKFAAISPADFDVKKIEGEILTEEVQEILELYKTYEAEIGDGTEDGGSLGLGTLTSEDYEDVDC